MESNDDEVKFWYSKTTDPRKWLEDNRGNEYIELNKAAEVLAPYIFALSTRGFSREVLNEINQIETFEGTIPNALELRKTKWINRAIEELKK